MLRLLLLCNNAMPADPGERRHKLLRLKLSADYCGSFVPTSCSLDDGDHRQHHRHFDQHAHDRGEGRARLQAEQADRGGHGQLEEIGRADQRGGRGHAPCDAEAAAQPIGQAGIEIDLMMWTPPHRPLLRYRSVKREEEERLQ